MSGLLVDSQALLWLAYDDARLSDKARRALMRPGAEIFFSAASIWEISIKLSIKKLELSEPFEVLLEKQVSVNRLQILEISMAHALAVRELPFNHRDPFDRLLVAQAKTEGLAILSSDTSFDKYIRGRIW